MANLSKNLSEVSCLRALCRVGMFFFCLSLPTFAQQSVPEGPSGQSEAPKSPAPKEPVLSQRQTPVLKSTDRQIILDVVVTDQSGKPVSGLIAADFTVLDNKQPRKIFSFHAAEGAMTVPPVNIILLIDTVNTSFDSVASELLEIKRFLRQNGGQLARPVSIVLFSESGAKTLSRPSRDGNALIAALDQNPPALGRIDSSLGFGGDMKRLKLSLHTLRSIIADEAEKPGRDMLIWISPGWSTLSEEGSMDPGSKDEHQVLFDLIVDFSTAFLEDRMTLYSINPSGVLMARERHPFFYQGFLKGVSRAEQTYAGNLALQVLAYQSGGRVLESGNDLASQIASCISDASVFYGLSFYSPAAAQMDQYHELEVKIGKPGLTVRSKTGYYAQPPGVGVPQYDILP